MAASDGIPFLEDDPNDDQDEDLHLCGRCRATFADIAEFFNHKKSCKAKKNIEKKPDDFNLATDEAAVISLLANQLSSHNSSQLRPNDDLDHLTLVFKEELDAISPDQLTTKSPIKKCQEKKKVQTTSMKTSDNQTKMAIKLVKGDRKMHPCSVIGCKFTAQHPKDLTRHMRSHTGEKPFLCKYCSKSFSRQDKVKNHERIHTGEKPYVCQLCTYGTADSGSLKKHMRIHTDERPFKCQLCPYRSRDSSQLTVHLRTHTNDRPFVCPYETCGAAFKTNSDLKRHDKLHRCSYCPFKSASQTIVKSHINSDHKELLSAYKCNECNFKTNTEVKLKTHERTHQVPVQQFSCGLCDFKASTKLKIVNHERKLHPKSEEFMCTSCNFKASSQALLMIHRKKKHPKKKKPKLENEVGIVVKKEPKKENYVHNFSCNICASTFVREDSLKSHLRQHQQRHENSAIDLIPPSDVYEEEPSVQYLLFPNTPTASNQVHLPVMVSNKE